MPVVNGCSFPDDLLYDVEHQLWYRERPDGLIAVGMTAAAVEMVGGHIVAITPKRAGRHVAAGQSCAVIESGKFVGPAKLAFDADVIESNEMLLDRPGVANTDPYGAAWLVVVKPADWPAARARLIPGDVVAEPYRAKMARMDFAGCGPQPS